MSHWNLRRFMFTLAGLLLLDATPIDAQDTARVASPPIDGESSTRRQIPLKTTSIVPPLMAMPNDPFQPASPPPDELPPVDLQPTHRQLPLFSERLGLDIYSPPEPDEFSIFHRDFAIRSPSHIDQAVPMHVFRMQVDWQCRMNHPDRAEYFWPKNGVFQNLFGHEDAKGPIQAESRVDALDVNFYTEVMIANHVSMWTNVPFRSVNPEMNLNESGVGDISAGLKWAFILDPRRAVALQVAGIFPTGEGVRGLGSENYWVQPGILWQEALTENLTLYMDVHDRMPVNPRSDFTGHVMRYGAGLSYLVDLGTVRIMPLAEIVGWTVLNGKQSFQLGKIEPLIQSARGMTIFDMYYGMRFSLGDDTVSQGLLAMSDLFVSYGHTISGNWWFENQWRLEYRVRF